MKKIAALLAVVMCLCALAAPVSALSANGSYGKVPLYDGTITIDGKIDEIYKKGLKIEIAGDYGKASLVTDATGNAYLLYDGSYIYVAVEVDNKYPLGEYLESTTSWKETGFEIYFDWTDKGVMTESDKFMVWANGKVFDDTSGKFANKTKIVECKSVQDAEKRTYVVELKVSLPDTVKAGSSIGWTVAVASNDDPKAPGQQHIAVPTALDGKAVCNAPEQWYSFILDSAKVQLDTTAATQKAPASSGSSATTFDAAVVLAVVAAVAGTGVVVSKKKH